MCKYVCVCVRVGMRVWGCISNIMFRISFISKSCVCVCVCVAGGIIAPMLPVHIPYKICLVYINMMAYNEK